MDLKWWNLKKYTKKLTKISYIVNEITFPLAESSSVLWWTCAEDSQG